MLSCFIYMDWNNMLTRYHTQTDRPGFFSVLCIYLKSKLIFKSPTFSTCDAMRLPGVSKYSWQEPKIRLECLSVHKNIPITVRPSVIFTFMLLFSHLRISCLFGVSSILSGSLMTSFSETSPVISAAIYENQFLFVFGFWISKHE